MSDESLPNQFRRQVSHRASDRFFNLVEAIGRHNEPTETQLNALESSYQSTGDFLSSCPEFDGLLEQIHAQGSRQIGTIVRPLDRSREGFDIDLVARLNRNAMQKYGSENGPTLLLRDLHLALMRYANVHGLKIVRWDRCVTLEYAGGMCADIAPVIDSPLFGVPYGDTHGYLPDRFLKGYSSTNPRGYAKNFNDAAIISPNFDNMIKSFAQDSLRADIVPLPNADDVFDRLLSRLVQLLKTHRNVAFGSNTANPDCSPNSVFITTLAAAAYVAKAPQFHDSPLDLLLDIVEAMPNYFSRTVMPDGSEEWSLSNPSAPNDNLASGMNSRIKQTAFHQWHQKLLTDLRTILSAIENYSGLDTLLVHIESAFGTRAAQTIRLDETKRIEDHRKSNKVSIFTASSIAAVSIPAKAHTFYGDI